MLFDRKWLILWFALLAVSCDTVSDTGFVGTWARPMGEVESVVSIDRDESGYSFCWSRAEVKGTGSRHACVGPNRTEVYSGADAVYAYEFTVRPGDSENQILVDVEGKPLDGRSTPVHFLDELNLLPGGLVLESKQIELNHTPRNPAGVPVRFAKVSDRPL